MKSLIRLLLTACAWLLTASCWAATHSVVVTYTSGATLRAMPANVSLSTWGSNAVTPTAASAPDLGKYSFTLDDASGYDWLLFSGSSQPSAWSAAIGRVDLRAEATQDEVGELASIPVNQVTVPPSRTWTPKRTSAGLVGELPLGATVGEEHAYAIDFRGDLPTNGRIVDLLSIEVYYEDEDDEPEEPGLTISEDEDDLGIDKTQAKFKITPVTAGTYKLRARVRKSPQDGGGISIATVELVAGP